MRAFGCALLGVLFVTLSASAQQQQETVDSVLRGWEKAMSNLDSFVAKVDRKTVDIALGGTPEDFKGYAMFQKTALKNDSSRARLELVKMVKDKPVDKVFEKYICTGTYLYEYVPATSVIRIHDMPQNKKDGIQGESFLSFLFGMGAEQALKRYDMRIVYPKDDKTGKYVMDPHYHYLHIIPKTSQDKADFTEAQLSLYRANNLPARIHYLQPNKNTVTWSFTELQVDRKGGIPLQYFQPDEPKGWRTERVQQKAPTGVPPKVRN